MAPVGGNLSACVGGRSLSYMGPILSMRPMATFTCGMNQFATTSYGTQRRAANALLRSRSATPSSTGMNASVAIRVTS